ncbi:phage protein [Streptococcus pneumoniae]|nr:phage protein [Streptococcus pneumoniae]
MIELYFIYNGHRKILIGSFGHIHSAINELKKHQASYSDINPPRFRKSMSGENIRFSDLLALVSLSHEM